MAEMLPCHTTVMDGYLSEASLSQLPQALAEPSFCAATLRHRCATLKIATAAAAPSATKLRAE